MGLVENRKRQKKKKKRKKRKKKKKKKKRKKVARWSEIAEHVRNNVLIILLSLEHSKSAELSRRLGILRLRVLLLRLLAALSMRFGNVVRIFLRYQSFSVIRTTSGMILS
nr:uncharacterized protein LOC116426586 [Nomia melanderi]